MKKTTAINFTAKEIEALQISISAEQLNLAEEVDRLVEHNKTGINTKSIRLKLERIKDLEALFDKLYDAEKLIQ